MPLLTMIIMRKNLKLTFVLFFLSTISFAQVNPQTIGVRLGGGTISGGELSYQMGKGDANRLEFDLGFGANSNHNRLYLVGAYHWNWNITEGLNWYAGPAASVGIYSYNDEGGFVNIAFGGQVGIEYDFTRLDAPILLSLDARPMWNFIGDHAGLGWGTSLGIRYIF
jgi:hypothetical protein